MRLMLLRCVPQTTPATEAATVVLGLPASRPLWQLVVVQLLRLLLQALE